ncbi:hypothetical protein T484DRAFT_1787836 [Baffinella frigidus]|nr:hypothetical protein T484DRAFT_1787836 [Cryptophyta sp. CCMP2293]
MPRFLDKAGVWSHRVIVTEQHMPRFLDKAGVWSHRVIVAEQSQRGLFNKGVMFNVGVKHAEAIGVAPGVMFNVGVKHAEAIGCDYMVMNDVDQLPSIESRLELEPFPSWEAKA